MEFKPITLQTVEYEGVKLRFKKPHTFYPFKESGSDLLEIVDEGLNIFIHGKDFEELSATLGITICFVWEEYAQYPDDEMTQECIELKRRLLDAIEEL